jgi:hypothetical protein
MSSATVAPYGEWISPITAELVSGSNNRFNEVHVDVSGMSAALSIINGGTVLTCASPTPNQSTWSRAAQRKAEDAL